MESKYPIFIHLDVEVPSESTDEINVMLLLEAVMKLARDKQITEAECKRISNWFYKKYHDDEWS